MMMISMTLKKFPNAADKVWKNPPERFVMNARDVSSRVVSDKLCERLLMMSSTC